MASVTFEEAQQIVDFIVESNAIEDERSLGALGASLTAYDYLCNYPYINSGIILRTHKRMMYDIDKGIAGFYRNAPVSIGGRIVMGVGKEIHHNVELLCEQMNHNPQDWQAHHIQFEKIHPFFDGNGRLGRMLMNWERQRAGLPILVIKEQEKYDYYQWFRTGSDGESDRAAFHTQP